MSEPRPGRWKRRLLAAALIVPALGTALWFGNVWWLTRERDRLYVEAARFGPVVWRELAEQALAEQQANPGAREEVLEAVARLGLESGRSRGFPSIYGSNWPDPDWLEELKGRPAALPDFALQTLAAGDDALKRLLAVAGKPPGMLTTDLLHEDPVGIVLDHDQDLRHSTDLLQLDGLASEQAGDARRAYRTAIAASRLPRQLDREPFLICMLIAQAMERTAALRILPIALRTGPASAAEFLALDAAWA